MNANTSPKYARCADTHKPLPIGDYLIYGGSCIHPMVEDADIYVGLDLSMEKNEKSYPWNEGESFLFYIQDQKAPPDLVQFNKMIDWLSVQLIAGKKIHVGCIGGHGRTGTVLAALVVKMTGNKDAIKYVRDNYCDKAVESQEQIDFLVSNFGCNPYPSRGYSYVSNHQWHSKGVTKLPKAGAFEISGPVKTIRVGEVSYSPVKTQRSIWGSTPVKFCKP